MQRLHKNVHNILINYIHGVKSFLRNYSLISWSRNWLHFMEPKINYCIRAIPSLVHIQIQIILVHTFPPHIFKKNFNMPHLCSSIFQVDFFLQILLLKTLYTPLEQSCLLECDVSLGEYFPTFRRHRDTSECRGKHISAIPPWEPAAWARVTRVAKAPDCLITQTYFPLPETSKFLRVSQY